MKCQRFKSRKLLIILTNCVPKLSFHLLVWLSYCLYRWLQNKGHTKVSGQTYGYWSIQLWIFILQRQLVKDWRGAEHFSWAVVCQLLATGAWRFPQWQTCSLKRSFYTTNVPLHVTKALLFHNSFQHGHSEIVSLLKFVIKWKFNNNNNNLVRNVPGISQASSLSLALEVTAYYNSKLICRKVS